MGFLIIFGAIGLLAYLNVATVRSFRRRQAGSGWWTLLTFGWAAGAAVGVMGGFFFEYQPRPELRVVGAPVPVAFFHWEGPPGEERWIDFITQPPFLFAGSNVVILGLLAACPIGLAFRLLRRGFTGSSEPCV